MRPSLATEESRAEICYGLAWILPLTLIHFFSLSHSLFHTHTHLHSYALLQRLKQLQTHWNVCATDWSYFKSKKKRDIIYFSKSNKIAIVHQMGFWNWHVLFLSCHEQSKQTYSRNYIYTLYLYHELILCFSAMQTHYWNAPQSSHSVTVLGSSVWSQSSKRSGIRPVSDT